MPRVHECTWKKGSATSAPICKCILAILDFCVVFMNIFPCGTCPRGGAGWGFHRWYHEKRAARWWPGGRRADWAAAKASGRSASAASGTGRERNRPECIAPGPVASPPDARRTALEFLKITVSPIQTSLRRSINYL